MKLLAIVTSHWCFPTRSLANPPYTRHHLTTYHHLSIPTLQFAIQPKMGLHMTPVGRLVVMAVQVLLEVVDPQRHLFCHPPCPYL